MYIIIKLSANTIPFIEKVKIPKKPKYLEYLGSSFIYSVEYIWTKKEINATTQSIMAVILSIKIPKRTLKSVEANQIVDVSKIVPYPSEIDCIKNETDRYNTTAIRKIDTK